MPAQIGLTATQILEALQRKPRLSPVLIAAEASLTPGTVRNVLVTLSELKLVKMPARGIYEISELGEDVLRENKETKK